jgi:hypothetical protein
VQFTASADLHDELERLRALMRSKVPDGDLAAIIDQAVTEKLERLEARRFGATKTRRKSLSESDTSPRSRHIPAAIRRAVRERDGKIAAASWTSRADDAPRASGSSSTIAIPSASAATTLQGTFA